jgi:hypothetical protein
MFAGPSSVYVGRFQPRGTSLNWHSKYRQKSHNGGGEGRGRPICELLQAEFR